MLVAATLALGGCAAGEPHTGVADTTRQEPTYGELPTFLPTSSLRPDGELTGTALRPALTSEGGTVRAITATGSVHATVTGPMVPVEGAANQPATTCTWTVALTGARGRVPVAVSAFTVSDEAGNESHPRLAPGSSSPPAAIEPGQTVRFELRDVIPVGEGVLRWAPAGQLVASWDFVAETD